MIGKNELRDSILHEYKVIKQLVSKLPDGVENYRISDDQRSTIELLRYLVPLGPGTLHAAKDSSFAWFGANAERFEALGLADMPAALDESMTEIAALFDGISDEQFEKGEVAVEGMGEWTVQGWLLNTTARFVPAYKLMLFHHAKAAGNGELNTWDAWMDNGEVPRPAPAS